MTIETGWVGQSIRETAWKTVGRAPSISAPRLVVPSGIGEESLETLARVDAPLLIEWIENGELDGADTALAIEVAARMLPLRDTLSMLLESLKHRSPIVRESAVYALGEHASQRRSAREALAKRTVPAIERSPAVREAAANILAMYSE